MDVDWNHELTEQLDWHWRNQLRPRLDGLTDDEYFWEPVEGCWNVRPRGTGTAPIQAGSGDFTIDWAWPEPSPPPVTTIAWRLGHVVMALFGLRLAGHFGGPPVDPQTWPYAGSAAEALRQLDEGYAAWHRSASALGEHGLARECGPSEGPWAKASMATLVLHMNREVIHHGAELALLRDLYARRRQ